MYKQSTRVSKISLFIAANLFFCELFALPAGANRLRIYEQQYVNRTLDSSRIRALNNYQSQEFSPEEAEVFQIRSFWFDISKLHLFINGSQEGSALNSFSRVNSKGHSQVLMLVHPESEDFFQQHLNFAEAGPIFMATSTASSRTLLVWQEDDPEKVFFGKLSLAKEIGGVVRTIPRGEVARSLGVSKILERIRNDLPSNFDFLPEFLGLIPRDLERGGMILRAFPKQYLSGERHLMPMFALYTPSKKTGKSPLQRMIETSGKHPREILRERLFKPFIHQWLELVIDQGITMEAHAQNVLLEINSRNLPSGKFVHRDFGGFNIDLSFRREKNLPLPAGLPVIETENSDYHQEHHLKAIKQSLLTHFEGGFLYGLSKELKRLRYRSLDYDNLILEVRELLAEELKRRGGLITKQIHHQNFYDDVVNAILKQRSDVQRRIPSCSEIIL